MTLLAKARMRSVPIMKTIAIIGGGVAGVTTAYALVRRGFDVSIIDRNRYAAMDTSFANGGQLSASNAEVWNQWGTMIKGMKWMLRPDAPLLFNPKPSWHKYSWMAEFVAAARHFERNTVNTVKLAIKAREFLHGWAEEEGVDFDVVERGILHVYRNKKAYDHAAYVSTLYEKGGLKRRALAPEEIKQIEPTIHGEFYGGFFTDSDATGDIHKYTTGLLEAAKRRGARHLGGVEVNMATTNGERVRLDVTAAGKPEVLEFDGVCVSAGVWSRELARQLGDRVNIYPVKGYSITVALDDAQSQASAPYVSLLDDETKIVASRLGKTRFRVAGTAEFNGYDRDIRDNRVRPLTRWVEQLFPNVSTEHCIPWAGLRPMMPDMLPKVGQGRAPNVFYNTGHGHLGWTLSAATADIIAETIAGVAEKPAAKAVAKAA
jgi:D-amino-acid dehydrogenase